MSLSKKHENCVYGFILALFKINGEEYYRERPNPAIISCNSITIATTE
jgi:hypothetical protein